jgi:hypothetical protein
MSWHYRAPQLFPALFVNTLRTAASCPDQSVMLGADNDRHNINLLAEKFRWFKWCVRKRPEAMPDLFKILSTYDVRSKVFTDKAGSILFVIARPTKVSEFMRLNPELAAQIVPECQ